MAETNDRKVAEIVHGTGPGVSKYAEITPDPEQLKLHAKVATIKPGSGVVLVYGDGGAVLARYFDREFAEEEFAAAGLKLADFLGATVAKAEQEAARNRKRAAAMPNRRLRGERRKERGAKAAKAEKPDEAAA